MAEGRFATSISCMDGRIQDPISAWIRANNPVDHVDVITRPGIDGMLAAGREAGSVREMTRISVDAHKSGLIVVSGHHDCAGNPVTASEHAAHIAAAVREVESWGLGPRVAGAWVDERWAVNPV